MSEEHFDAIDTLREAKSAASVIESFGSLIEKFGYDHFLITDVPHPKTGENIKSHTLLNGWSKEWYDRYTEKNYLPDDPIAAHVFNTPHAYAWSDVVISDKNPVAHEIMDDARSVGMHEGLVVPIFALSGFQSAVTMAGRAPSLKKSNRYVAELAAMYAYGRVRQLLIRENNLNRPLCLSARERECLIWVAQGKSDWEVGEILSISQHTAKEYVRNATRKLNSVTRAQAVAEALRLGEISF